MTYLITQTLNGLFSAALPFLIASGLTLVFGVMRIVNIAHGSFFMLGVYVAHTIVSRTCSLLLGELPAVVVVAAIGLVMERVFLRRLATRPLAQMTMTMIRRLRDEGISTLLAEQNAAFAVTAADYVHVMSKGAIVYSSEPAALWNNDAIKTQLLGVPRSA